MGEHPGVGAEGDLDPVAPRQPEGPLVALHDGRELLLDDLGVAPPRGPFQEPGVLVGILHQERPSLDHELSPFLVQEGPVLDGGHPRAHRPLDPFGAVRVRRDLPAPGRRLVHQRVELFLGVERGPHRLLLRHRPRGRGHFDDVGAVLHLEAHLLADLLDAVGHTGVLFHPDIGGEPVQVPVAAGGADGHGGRLDPGAGDVAAIDRIAERHVHEVGRPDVADSGEARLQCTPGVDRCQDRGVDRTSAEAVLVAAPFPGDVGMAIDQAGQHGRAAQVDDLGAAGMGSPAPTAVMRSPSTRITAFITSGPPRPSIKRPARTATRAGARGVESRWAWAESAEAESSRTGIAGWRRLMRRSLELERRVAPRVERWRSVRTAPPPRAPDRRAGGRRPAIPPVSGAVLRGGSARRWPGPWR